MTAPARESLMIPWIAVCLSASLAVCQQDERATLPAALDFATVALPKHAAFEPFALPGDGRVHAVAGFGDELWLARGEELLAVRVADGSVHRRRALPDGLLGLTADDRWVYVLRHRAVGVLDPVEMDEVLELPLARAGDSVPQAIGTRGDELFVAWSDGVTAIDKVRGTARDVHACGAWIRWLASDGTLVFGGDGLGFGPVDLSRPAGDGTLAERVGPAPSTTGLGAFVAGRLLLVREGEPREGAAARASAGFVEPGAMLSTGDAGEKLIVEVHANGGGAPTFVVGPMPVRTLRELRAQFERIAASPSCRVAGLDGQQVQMPMVIEVVHDVGVDDLLRVYDCAVQAGFRTVLCVREADNAPWRRATVEPPPPPPFRGPNGGR